MLGHLLSEGRKRLYDFIDVLHCRDVWWSGVGGGEGEWRAGGETKERGGWTIERGGGRVRD